jgi:hypothetical protein
MSHVHSADGRRPGHPAGGVPVHSGSRQYARAATYDVLIITRTCQGSFRCTPMLRRLRISGRKEIALATGISCSKYYIRYVPGPACRGSASLYVPPLSYKKGGHTTLQGRLTQALLDSDTLRPSSGSQVHTSSQAQYITQWSRVRDDNGYPKPEYPTGFTRYEAGMG